MKPHEIAALRELARLGGGTYRFDNDERYDREADDCSWEQWIVTPDGRRVELPGGSWDQWRFLVAAANNLPAALDEIERLRAQLEQP